MLLEAQVVVVVVAQAAFRIRKEWMAQMESLVEEPQRAVMEDRALEEEAAAEVAATTFQEEWGPGVTAAMEGMAVLGLAAAGAL